MSGIDEILEMISAQQKETEDSIIKAAQSKAAQIISEGEVRAKAAYEEYIQNAKQRSERDYENGCNAADAEMKRRILASKVDLVDEAIEKTIAKLKALPDAEYFELLARLVQKHLRSGEGVISLGSNDLKRVPADFEKKLGEQAAGADGTIRLSKEPADIDDGFILSYGLISEDCSFRAIIEAETEGVRDIAAKELFGQVKA
ncbi:MAG: H(+)-transporting ATPase [Ruminococcus sp.]|nr:H(+)-transporting ATPase [Ruminococcus sp.]